MCVLPACMSVNHVQAMPSEKRTSDTLGMKVLKQDLSILSPIIFFYAY